MAAGVLAIIQGILFIAQVGVFFSIAKDLAGLMIAIGLAEIFLGIMSFIAGRDARRRKEFGSALTGAVLGMIAFGFVIGAFLGLAAVVLIALSREEFSSSKAEQIENKMK